MKLIESGRPVSASRSISSIFTPRCRAGGRGAIFRHMVHKRAGEVVSSCKLYDLTMRQRGSDFRVLGIGAVYTLEAHRGQGCATSLLDDVVSLAQAEGYDALMLYSEIGTDFYEQWGFEEIGSADFSIHFNCPPPEEPNESEERTRFLRHADIHFLSRHHERWLRRQPYGVVRSEVYWHFKLAKELFLQKHSRLSWPTLELLTVNEDGEDSGYMITEQSGSTVRLLEVVGTDNARIELWKRLLARAYSLGAQRIRGWESGVADLAPSFSLDQVLPEQLSTGQLEPLMYCEREWGVADDSSSHSRRRTLGRRSSLPAFRTGSLLNCTIGQDRAPHRSFPGVPAISSLAAIFARTARHHRWFSSNDNRLTYLRFTM